MGRACPEALQVVLEVLVGLRWPDADEDALHAAAEQWERLGAAVTEARDHAGPAAAALFADDAGPATDALAAVWDGLCANTFPLAIATCDGLATSLREFAGDVESTKQFIVIQLGILSTEIALGIAGTVLTVGVSDVVADAAVVVTRLAIRRACAELAERAATTAARLAVKGMVDGLLNDTLLQGLRATNGGSRFNLTELFGAVGGGAAGGLVGGHLATRAAGLGSLGARTAGHVAAGVAGNDALVGTQSAITGVPFNPGVLLGGAGRGVLAAGTARTVAPGDAFTEPAGPAEPADLGGRTDLAEPAAPGEPDPIAPVDPPDAATPPGPTTPDAPARPDLATPLTGPG